MSARTCPILSDSAPPRAEAGVAGYRNSGSIPAVTFPTPPRLCWYPYEVDSTSPQEGYGTEPQAFRPADPVAAPGAAGGGAGGDLLRFPAGLPLGAGPGAGAGRRSPGPAGGADGPRAQELLRLDFQRSGPVQAGVAR